MENREIILDCIPGLTRAAVFEDGRLVELHSERVGKEDLTESLFYGRIEQIRPSVCAAFVNIGLPQSAFLPIEDGEKLRCGDMIIVQGAAKQVTDSKGLRITRRINFAGNGVHISKKIKDVQLRAELEACVMPLCPQGCGLIVRTASGDVSPEKLEQEASDLYEAWTAAHKKAVGMRTPGVIMQRAGLEERLIRDLSCSALKRIVVSGEDCYARLCARQREGLIPQTAKVERYEAKSQLIFDLFGVEDACAKALKKRVWLPCGGYLIIDCCEAMTVIDVNSGKMTLGRHIEETALRVNLEAAREIAVQLRLRSIGGVIVADFIDMQSEESRREVLKTLKEACAADRCGVKVEGITRLGLVEMTRKRVEERLDKRLLSSCACCSGTGEMLCAHETARRALYAVRRLALAGQRGPFAVRLAAAEAQELVTMGAPEDIEVYAVSLTQKHGERFDIEQLGAGKIPEGAIRLTKRVES